MKKQGRYVNPKEILMSCIKGRKSQSMYEYILPKPMTQPICMTSLDAWKAFLKEQGIPYEEDKPLTSYNLIELRYFIFDVLRSQSFEHYVYFNPDGSLYKGEGK
jgi:hypothetical protein